MRMPLDQMVRYWKVGKVKETNDEGMPLINGEVLEGKRLMR